MAAAFNLSLSPQGQAFVALLVALLAITVIVILSKRSSKARGNTLVLVGPPDAGKTAILSMLAYGQALPTHTSLQANASSVTLQEKQRAIRIIDIPGHPRIRDQFREYIDDAKAIAFVVDASTISRNAQAVAEHLHNILHTLTSLPPSQRLPSVVIVAHKTDLLPSAATAPDTLAINRVKTVLERELQRRRVSQSEGVGVESLGAEGEKSELGGLETTGPVGGAFKFVDWEGGEITFIGTSSRPGREVEDGEKVVEIGLSSLRDWLNENM